MIEIRETAIFSSWLESLRDAHARIRVLARILRLPDVQAKLKGLGGEISTLSPEQFSQLNRQEFERFGVLIKQANIKLE